MSGSPGSDGGGSGGEGAGGVEAATPLPRSASTAHGSGRRSGSGSGRRHGHTHGPSLRPVALVAAGSSGRRRRRRTRSSSRPSPADLAEQSPAVAATATALEELLGAAESGSARGVRGPNHGISTSAAGGGGGSGAMAGGGGSGSNRSKGVRFGGEDEPGAGGSNLSVDTDAKKPRSVSKKLSFANFRSGGKSLARSKSEMPKKLSPMHIEDEGVARSLTPTPTRSRTPSAASPSGRRMSTRPPVAEDGSVPPRREPLEVALSLPEGNSGLAAGTRALASVQAVDSAQRPSRWSSFKLGAGEAIDDLSDESSIDPAELDSSDDEKTRARSRPKRKPPSSTQLMREGLRHFVDSQRFDNFIILCIFVNCAFLAAMNPLDQDPNSPRNRVLSVAEWVFQTIFTAEMVLKIVAHGVLTPIVGYVHSGWNVIDGTIVILGWIALASGGGNVSSIRVIRIMRPLRRIQTVPGLKILIDSMLASGPQLANVLALCAFIFLIFGIVGVQLFMGRMHQRCHWPLEDGSAGMLVDPDIEGDRLCSTNPKSGRQCPELEGIQTVCAISNLAPNGNITHFDNTAVAFLTIFQCISLEGWVDVTYWLMESSSGWVVLYFSLLILFGSLFLLNLVVAVITLNLTAKGRAEIAEARAARWIAAAERSATSSAKNGPETADVLTALIAAKLALQVENKEDEMAQKIRDEKTALNVNNEEARRREYRRQFSRRELYLMDHKGFKERHILRYRECGVTEGPNGAMELLNPQDSSLAPKPALEDRTAPRVLQIAGWFFSPPTAFSPDFRADDESALLDHVGPLGAHALDILTSLSARRAAMRILHGPLSRGLELDLAVLQQESLTSGQLVQLLTHSAHRCLIEAHRNPQHIDVYEQQLKDELTALETLRRDTLEAYGLEQAAAAIANTEGATDEDAPLLLMDAGPSGGADEEKEEDTTADDRSVSSLESDIAPLDPHMPTNKSPAWRWSAYTIVRNEWFTASIMSLIVVNTIFLAMEYDGMPPKLSKALDSANIVVSAVFFVEMVIKIMGLGIEGYVADSFNIFDASIVVVSIVELALSTESPAVSALRIFRLLRVFKLARQWKTLNRLLVNMGRSVPRIWPFTIVLTMFMFIFSLMGMQLFGGRFGSPPPRSHYDTLGWAFITTFQIITGENWNEVMYAGIDNVGVGSVFYFISLVVIGTYIVLNLFLAILIESFANEDDDDEEEEPFDEDRALVERKAKQLLEGGDVAGTFAAESDDDLNLGNGNEETAPQPPAMFRDYAAAARRRKRAALRVREAERLSRRQAREGRLFDKHPSYPYSSFGKFDATHPLRSVCGKIAVSSWFDIAILVLIIFSCVLLAMDRPTLNPDTQAWMKSVDVYVTLIFVAEMLIKLVAFGMYSHPGAYLKDSWNVLDGFIVVVSVVNVTVDLDTLAVLKVFRSLRALRPLRMIRRLAGLRMVVDSVAKATPPVINVGLVTLLFFLIFGILGTNLFGGLLKSCNDPERLCEPSLAPDCPAELACVGTFVGEEGGNITRAWINPSYGTPAQYSFDNVAASMLTLFEVASLELWLEVMYSAVDITERGWAPERDANSGAALFFILFVIVSSLFILNLFVTVVVDNFTKVREEMTYSDSAFMTPGQRKWIEVQRLVLDSKPPKRFRPRTNKIRQLCFDLGTSAGVELFVMLCICLNIVAMTLRHRDESQGVTRLREASNYVFGMVFLLEMLVKLVGLGWKTYWTNLWDAFDGTIVIVSTVDLLASDVLQVDLTLLRAVRMVRIFRLIKTSRGLRALFKTLLLSLPSLGNVGALLLLLFFVFAVAGVNLFGELPRGEFLTEHANFENFGNAMFLMYRMSTGESWNGIMHDCMQQNKAMSIIYFTLFVVLGQFVMLNLFVAVILENFEREMAAEADKMSITANDIDAFSDAWTAIHPRWKHSDAAKGYDRKWLPAELLPELILKLQPPLGLDAAAKNSRSAMMRYIRVIDVPMNPRGEVNYSQTLRAIVRRVCGEDIPTDVDEAIHGLAERLPTQFRQAMGEASGFTFAQLYAAELLQERYAERLDERKRAQERSRLRQRRAKSARFRVKGMLTPLAEAGASIPPESSSRRGRRGAGRHTKLAGDDAQIASDARSVESPSESD